MIDNEERKKKNCTFANLWTRKENIRRRWTYGKGSSSSQPELCFDNSGYYTHTQPIYSLFNHNEKSKTTVLYLVNNPIARQIIIILSSVLLSNRIYLIRLVYFMFTSFHNCLILYLFYKRNLLISNRYIFTNVWLFKVNKIFFFWNEIWLTNEYQ